MKHPFSPPRLKKEFEGQNKPVFFSLFLFLLIFSRSLIFLKANLTCAYKNVHAHSVGAAQQCSLVRLFSISWWVCLLVCAAQITTAWGWPHVGQEGSVCVCSCFATLVQSSVKNTLLLSRSRDKARVCVKCTPIAINTHEKLHFRINRKTVWNAQYKRCTSHTLTTNSYTAIHWHKTEGCNILRAIVYTHSGTQLSLYN